MKKKQSKIKNLIVAPLLASAIFLSSPTTFAGGPVQKHQAEVHNISNAGRTLNTKRGIAGRVSRVNGDIIIVSTKDDTEYTVDASDAMIMKEGVHSNENPAIVETKEIKVGDAIVVRGIIADDNELF